MVKMSLGNSTSQGSSTSSISSSRISAYNGAISSLNSFIGASNLQGNAYSSAKSYAGTVLIPPIQGAILLSEAVSNAVTTFPSRYTSEVAGESLDSEVLEAQIATYQAAYDRSSAWLTSEMSKKVLNESSILRAQQSMARNLGKVTELQEKLDKLMAFNASSPSLFDEISGLYSAVSQGLSQVSSDYNSFNKTKNFPEYNSANLSWVQTINAQVSTSSDKNKEILNKAEEARKRGWIDENTLNSIKSGILSGTGAFTKELIKSKITDEAVDKFTEASWKTLSQNINTMQYGLVGSLAGGGGSIVSLDVNPGYANLIRSASPYVKYAPVGIGAAIDFGSQVADGESTTDAAIKTGAHVAIGVAGAAAGKIAGTAVAGALATSVIGAPLAPIAGIAVDFVVTSAISVGGSMIFDAVYDNKEEIIDWSSDKLMETKESLDNIGDAISGIFSGLGSVFN